MQLLHVFDVAGVQQPSSSDSSRYTAASTTAPASTAATGANCACSGHAASPASAAAAAMRSSRPHSGAAPLVRIASQTIATVSTRVTVTYAAAAPLSPNRAINTASSSTFSTAQPVTTRSTARWRSALISRLDAPWADVISENDTRHTANTQPASA